MSKGKVLITGTSSGIGRDSAILFLEKGYEVIGLDIDESAIAYEGYTHYICDVGKKEQLPDIDGVEYLINNAGTIEEDLSLETNLMGYINVAEKYGFNDSIKSIVNVGSISGLVGLDTPIYAASQGGRISYTKNLAIRITEQYKVPVNCVAFGAVLTNLEPKLYAHDDLVQAVANENLLNKWIQPDEAAEWVYFVAVKNKSMTGQVILIDNGEQAKYNFIKAR